MKNIQATSKKSMIKMMLISLAPVLAFIFVDEYYGPKAGVIAGISLGILETTFLYITEKRIDKFSLGSTLLIVIMGSLSLFTGDTLFFKLKPAVVNIVMIMILIGSLFLKKPIMLLFAKKQFGENFKPNETMLTYFSGISVRMSILLIIHTIAIVYSAFYMSNAAWGFITKGGSFILMGIYLVFEFIYARFILPLKMRKSHDIKIEQKYNKIIKRNKTLPLLLLLLISSCVLSPRSKTQTNDVFEAWSKQSLYFIIPDRFYNARKDNDFITNTKKLDSFHGGDLAGIKKKRSYLKDLNFSSYLFTPIMASSAFHGYWIKNHFKLEEHLGTINELKAFNTSRKKDNIKLLLDIVLNHVDKEHPWIKDHPDWFHSHGDISDWNSYEDLTQGKLFGLPDLDQSNSNVYNELLRYTKFWIDLVQPDGLRLDAVKHIRHLFWKKFIGDISDYVNETYGRKDFLFLGEVFHGDPSYIQTYVDDGFNAFYNFPLYYTLIDVFAKNKSLFYLASTLQKLDSSFSPQILFLNFIDNHDVSRFLSSSTRANYKDMRQALAFIYSIKGIPSVYYGTESHLSGYTSDKGRAQMNFKQTPSYNYIAKLNKIRKNHLSLSQGIRENILINDNYYVFRKLLPNEESIVIITRSPRSLNLLIPVGDDSLFTNETLIKDSISQRPFQIKRRVLNANLKRKDAVIFTLKGPSKRYSSLINKKSSKVNITLRISTHSKNSNNIFIVGNLPCTGTWNTADAIGGISSYNEEHNCEIKLTCTRGKILEYKLFKKDRQRDIVWESGKTRYLHITQNLEVVNIESTL